MKKVKIYTREISQKTGFKKFAYRSCKQVIIEWNNSTFLSFDKYKVDLTKIKKPFNLVLISGNKKELEEYCSRLGRSYVDVFIKKTINKIIESEKSL